MVELAEFFSRLERFQALRHDEKCRVVDGRLRHICSQLPRFRQATEAHEKKVSPRFNIYRILRLERKEVLVHTPMLAELLDPLGTHGQGFMFLRLFLEMLEQHGLKPMQSRFEQHQWFVETEKPTGSHGNLDVLISCPELGCRIAIENKVGAGEQHDQIWRYWCWLRKYRQGFTQQILIFLTPTGREALTAQDAVYTRLSYHTDIRSWLTAALPQVESVAVSETVSQYLRIIENC
jgi:hypothetical protein